MLIAIIDANVTTHNRIKESVTIKHLTLYATENATRKIISIGYRTLCAQHDILKSRITLPNKSRAAEHAIMQPAITQLTVKGLPPNLRIPHEIGIDNIQSIPVVI